MCRGNVRCQGSNKDIFLAETQRDIATSLYANLKDFKVEMPANVIMGAGSSSARASLKPGCDHWILCPWPDGEGKCHAKGV